VEKEIVSHEVHRVNEAQIFSYAVLDVSAAHPERRIKEDFKSCFINASRLQIVKSRSAKRVSPFMLFGMLAQRIPNAE